MERAVWAICPRFFWITLECQLCHAVSRLACRFTSYSVDIYIQLPREDRAQLLTLRAQKIVYPVMVHILQLLRPPFYKLFRVFIVSVKRFFQSWEVWLQLTGNDQRDAEAGIRMPSGLVEICQSTGRENRSKSISKRIPYLAKRLKMKNNDHCAWKLLDFSVIA